MKIVALDLATTTGISVGQSGADPVAWSVDLGKGRSEGSRFSKALILTDKLIQEHKPDLVAIEAAIGGRDANAYLIGLVACVRGCCHNRKVPCEVFNLASIRKHFLGKHLTKQHFPHLKPAAAKKAIKDQVIKRCQMLGWTPEDDNAADALALHDYASAMRAPKFHAKPLGGLF